MLSSDLGDTDIGDLSYLEQTTVQMGAKHFKCGKILVTLVRRAAEVPRIAPRDWTSLLTVEGVVQM